MRAAVKRTAWAAVVACLVALPGCSDSKGAAPSPSGKNVAPPPTAPDPRHRSDDPIAVALDRSIVTPADVAPKGLEVKESPAVLEPQGPVNVDGLVAALGSFGEVMRLPLEQANAKVGGRRRYELVRPSNGPLGGPIVSVVAVRFPSGSNPAAIPSFAQSLLRSNPAGQTTAHSEATIGVIPVQVVRFPNTPSAGLEQLGVVAGYASGVAYIVQVFGPTGSVADKDLIALLQAQDDKFQAVKAQLGLG